MSIRSTKNAYRLRIEFLIQQLSQHLPINDHATALHFFRNVGDLLDVIERGDVRTELLKELERQQRKLQAGPKYRALTRAELIHSVNSLKQQQYADGRSPRWAVLREDRLIGLVRQRLSIPGGCCSFDLPTLHMWLHMPQVQRDAQVKSWLDSPEPMHHTLSLILDLIRNSAPFRKQTSLNGFYQTTVMMRICCVLTSL